MLFKHHLTRYISKQFWCSLYGTKNWILQFSFETQSSFCLFVCLFVCLFTRLLDSFAIAILKIKINPLSANFTKWSNTLKQFVGKLPTNCLSVFDHFVGLAFKGLKVLDSTNERFVHNIDGAKNNLEWRNKTTGKWKGFRCEFKIQSPESLFREALGLQIRAFPVNFEKFSRTSFLQNIYVFDGNISHTSQVHNMPGSS